MLVERRHELRCAHLPIVKRDIGFVGVEPRVTSEVHDVVQAGPELVHHTRITGFVLYEQAHGCLRTAQHPGDPSRFVKGARQRDRRPAPGAGVPHHQRT